MTCLDETLDELDHRSDVLGRLRHLMGVEDVEPPTVGDKLPGVEVGDLERLLPRPPGTQRHLVLSRIGVVDDVADIGDVHDLLHPVTEVLKGSPHHVRDEVGVEIPDVLPVIYGRTAVVDADRAGNDRLERTRRSRRAVVDADLGPASLDAFFSLVLLGCYRYREGRDRLARPDRVQAFVRFRLDAHGLDRSEEHTSELQSRLHLVCRLLLEKKKTTMTNHST